MAYSIVAYQELSPHPALRPFVDRFWVSAADAGAGPRRILPDGCIDVLVDLTRGGQALAVGTMTRATVFHPRAPVRIAAIRFRPGGAVPFLGSPADELTDRVVACDQLGLRWLAPASQEDEGEGEGEGEGLTGPIQAVRALQRRLLDRLRAIPRPDAVLAHAIHSLIASTAPSIAALSRELGWSRQHLGRVFRRQVGITPKQLARTARLQRALAAVQVDRDRGARPNLAAVAADLGYFDQAHMARDFREMAGVTPAAAGASAGSIFPIRSLFDEG